MRHHHGRKHTDWEFLDTGVHPFRLPRGHALGAQRALCARPAMGAFKVHREDKLHDVSRAPWGAFPVLDAIRRARRGDSRFFNHGCLRLRILVPDGEAFAGSPSQASDSGPGNVLIQVARFFCALRSMAGFDHHHMAWGYL